MSEEDKTDKIAQDHLSDPSRRSLLKGAGLMGAAAVGAAATGNIIAADSPPKENSFKTSAHPEALEVLTAVEAETLESICDCLIPSDEDGPGAKEARAVHYIDKSLASHNLSVRQNYMISLSAINDFSREVGGDVFYRLDRQHQNSILEAVEANEVPGLAPSAADFFSMVRSHTIDGTFCDPYYGGNRNFVGWDLLRYPGIRLGASEADVLKGSDLAPTHKSAYDHDTYTKLAGDIDTSGASSVGGG